MKLLALLPEILLSAMMTMTLIGLVVKKDSSCKSQNGVLLGLALVTLGVCFYTFQYSITLFSGTYRIDLLSQGFKALLALALCLVLALTKSSISIPDHRRGEYFLFATTATLGMMMMTSAVNFLTLYVSLELSSYSLYLLSALRKDYRVAESSSKYLIFGAATSGILLWGMSLMAGVSGSVSLPEISSHITAHMTQPAFVLGFIFVLFSFFFKLSAAPFHFWAPDVYEASATPVTTLIATASKAAAVAIIIRVFIFLGLSPNLISMLGVIAFVSMTLGNAAALVQTDVKRILAYSSIAQAGYILVGLLAGSFEAYTSSFFYAVAYVLMNTGAFFTVLVVSRAENTDNPQVSHFDGLAEKSPFTALILLLSLLSLAGIPPLVGFTGKWILFSASMDKGHWFLVLWGVLNSVVSLFYYLTLVKHAYLEKPKTSSEIKLCTGAKILGILLFAGIVILGIFPNELIAFSQRAIESTLLP